MFHLFKLVFISMSLPMVNHHDIQKSVEPKPLKYISAILPRNENKSITRENKTAVIQHFSEYIRWEQYLKSF